MREGDLEAKLERAEETYEDLVRTRASLGTVLAEAIRRGRDLSEFGRRMEDLPLLIRQADVRRAELKVELLARRLKEAEAAHGRAAEAASRTLASLEEAKKSHAKAASLERCVRSLPRRSAAMPAGLPSPIRPRIWSSACGRK